MTKDTFKKLNPVKITASTAPIIFTLVAIYATRSSIQVYFVLILALIVLELFLIKKMGLSFKESYPYILITGACIGLAASGILTIEKIELLKNPDFVASCSLSPVVACSPIINSPQASIFVLPNPTFGLIGFGALLTAGMTLLALPKNIKLPKWWWLSLLAGSLLGLVFVGWLIGVSLYTIKSLCLYCMSVWAVVIPVFITTLKISIDNSSISLGKKIGPFISKYPLEVVISFYAAVILLILHKFWYYWITLI